MGSRLSRSDRCSRQVRGTALGVSPTSGTSTPDPHPSFVPPRRPHHAQLSRKRSPLTPNEGRSRPLSLDVKRLEGCHKGVPEGVEDHHQPCEPPGRYRSGVQLDEEPCPVRGSSDAADKEAPDGEPPFRVKYKELQVGCGPRQSGRFHPRYRATKKVS